MSKQSYDAMYGTVEAECKACDGDGWIPASEQQCCGQAEFECGGRGCSGPRDVDASYGCEECQATGWIKCDTPMENGSIKCPFSYCYCEAAWERQQEDLSNGG